MNRRPSRPCRSCADVSFLRWTTRDCFTPEGELNMSASCCVLRPHPHHFSEAWKRLKMSNQPETSLPTCYVWKNNHSKWRTSRRAKHVVPPVRPAEVWGPKYTSPIQMSTHPVITCDSVPYDIQGAVTNSSIYSITLRKDGNVTCWTFFKKNNCFYLFFTNAGHFSFMFVVLPKFLLLAVLCLYCLSPVCHDSVITGRPNYEVLFTASLSGIIAQASSLFSVSLQMLEVLYCPCQVPDSYI